MASFQLAPNITLTITSGDIAAVHVDAVVNAANAALWMGSGVAGALKRAGGVEIEREAMAKGPIRPGEAVITSGGRLPARHVIHAAAMGEDLCTDAALIRAATAAALDLAEREGLTSIAFPALGTGVGGFAMDDCARIMIGVFGERANSLKSVSAITMVLFGEQAARVFASVANPGGAGL